MAPDKYKAVWVSHSSIADYLKCPRAYYLNNVYKDPETNRKINLITPQLALGQAVHNTLEALAEERIPAEERLAVPLTDRFRENWKQVSGINGGFTSEDEEAEFRRRGEEMVRYVEENPGPLTRKALTLPANNMPPNFYLSEDENIILCGKVDWLEYLEGEDAVHVIDFKTGVKEEGDDSLQLPIYLLLVHNLQKRPVARASYWYLDEQAGRGLKEKQLPMHDDAEREVLEAARKVKQAREDGAFECPRGEEGCFACRPFERIIRGEATYLGVNEIKQDMYALLDR